MNPRNIRATVTGCLVLMAAAVIAGCTHAAPTGAVSHEFVEPSEIPVPQSDAKKVTLSKPTSFFEDAKPLPPLRDPVFPAGWAKKVTMPMRILVKLEIDDQGRVTNVERSMLDFSPSTDLSERCYLAVKAAVSQWRFQPALVAQAEPEADGRPVIVSEHPVDTSLVVAFTLTSTSGVSSHVVGR